MATERPLVTATSIPQEKRNRSIFNVPANFFDACCLLSPSATSVSDTFERSENSTIAKTLDDETDDKEDKIYKNDAPIPRLTCNTCKAEFESLQDQRSHFKSDIHRINVKLSIAGKDIVNEEDLDDFTSDNFKDYDISSISGSEDEADKAFLPGNDVKKGSIESVKQKLFICLRTGERVSIWKCALLNDFESVSYENDKEVPLQCLKENEVIERLNFLIHEPRDKTRLRIVLLASGGHFAGCVFDGNSVMVHKTFHRYVVRAKAGKKQSSKDGSGRAAHSAGASLRRYNELALKKDIQELLAAWKPYFDASTSVFIHAPSSNRQLLFDGDKAYFSHQHCFVRNVPLSVRRPTLKEARRIYNQLTQVAYEADEKEFRSATKEGFSLSEIPATDSIQDSKREDLKDCVDRRDTSEASTSHENSHELIIPSEGESEVIGITTPLHEAAQSDDAHKVLELLEQGLDPAVKDEKGRTPYMLANEKEVRNTFRRFMASNHDRWDWHAAKVPSALTKEMEESQAAKQAEKDAKKKARAKELKKLRKAKEKAQAQAALSQNSMAASTGHCTAPTSASKGQPQPSGRLQLSKEEELERAQAAEREKRAAAAERRMAAALNSQGTGTTSAAKSGLATDMNCSCCNASLAGKIPFHRYNYKYCSTTCMHVHREVLEDG
ncbi:conserved hypothetical protein [Ricinus communis]|uniref:VLRF1 domain-containing protein n=1 Tax=Ricinus communis TaxID=3988 RepID=B9RDF0_RICCO|nr:conserved hypothetical protein [Ricinus communis]|eukprot:XP_002511739.1 ankyrin repeat and zinc finger domain-containing protein 1 [Ricinus communis]